MAKIQQHHQFQFVYTNYYNYSKQRSNRIYYSIMVKYQQHLMYILELRNQVIDLLYINPYNSLISWVLMMELINLSTISHKSLDYFFTFHQSTIKHLDSYSSQCLKSLIFTTKQQDLEVVLDNNLLSCIGKELHKFNYSGKKKIACNLFANLSNIILG